MTASHDPDRQFHDNLRRLGGNITMPAGPADEVRLRCAVALKAAAGAQDRRILKMIKKPAVLSAFGAAAMLAFVVGMLFPWGGGPEVHAALIVEKLNKQIEQDPLLEITLEALRVEEVSLNGHLQLSRQGIAGDVQVQVDDRDGRIDVDVSLGLTEQSGWVLIRKLDIPDAEARAILSMFLAPAGETLLLLPDGALAGPLGGTAGVDLGDALAELRSENVIGMLKQLIENHAAYGVTVEPQRDGTVLLHLSIDDKEALEGLTRLITDVANVEAQIAAVVEDEAVGGDEDAAGRRVEIRQEVELELSDEMSELLGCAVTLVYDPAVERVRSFSISDLGPMKGTVTVGLRDGEIDPALLDPDRVAGPNTRTVDLAALGPLLMNLQFQSK